MQMSPYLSFPGNCEEAFAHYERYLDGKLGPLFRYEGSPMAEGAPAGWSEKIMHGSITIGGVLLMGADIAPEKYDKPQGFSLSLQVNAASDAERYFAGLADGGTVVMPLEKTFWAERFGMVVDCFGVPWLVNCDGQTSGA